MRQLSLVLALVCAGLFASPSFAAGKREREFAEREWKALLAKFDTNHDGEISKIEVEAVLAAEKAKHQAAQAAKKEENGETAPVASRQHGNRNPNGNGNGNGARPMANHPPIHFVKDFTAIDANGDGVVTRAEFATYVEAQWAAWEAKKQQQGQPGQTPTPAPEPDPPTTTPEK